MSKSFALVVIVAGRAKGRYGGRTLWSAKRRIEAPEMRILFAALASRPMDPLSAILRGHVGFLQSTDPFRRTVLVWPSLVLVTRASEIGT